MRDFKSNKNNNRIIIVVTLFISLVLNIYTSLLNSKYRISLGRETYNSLLDIRTKNESSSNILNTCIKAKSINNQELFTLYKNFSSIDKEFNNLWLKYKNYNEKKISIGKKTIETYVNSRDVFKRIENFLYEYMNYQMKNDKEVISLEGNVLDNFSTLESLSRSLNEYFIEFDSKYYKDLDEEKKKLISIKKNHWVEALKDMNIVMEPYFTYEFIIKE
ncbi:hypothetical protein [Clostridium isatidis]|uniref:hypothetical protein n=1 Tax=Clostridium isatidis TaxID=182773 RepID=UPI003AADF3A4